MQIVQYKQVHEINPKKHNGKVCSFSGTVPGKGRLAKLVTHLENVSYTVPLDSRALAMRLDQVLGKHSPIFWKDLRRANLTML